MEAQAGRISHYRVLGELGRDRLGYVLRAADELLDRPVVLRVVRASAVFPPQRLQAVRAGFQREAKRAAGVSHPNLVTIYAFEPIGDVDLIAMELVEGASLRAMLALGDRWRIPDAAKLVVRIADALAAAHAARIAHGRLNLANVIVRPDGRVKVLDLGIPKLPEGAEGSEAGDPGRLFTRAHDPRPDVHALAALAWELAASAMRPPGALWRPTSVETDEMAAAVATPTAARARFGILGPVLSRALSTHSGVGFRDAGQFRDALLEALADPLRSEPVPYDVPAPVHHDFRPAATEPLSANPGELLDVDAAIRSGADAGGLVPRLVLPADLAHSREEPPPGGSFVVMTRDGVLQRFRYAADTIASRFGVRSGSRALVVLMIVAVAIIGGFITIRRLTGGDASAAIFAAGRNPSEATTPSTRPEGRATPAAGRATATLATKSPGSISEPSSSDPTRVVTGLTTRTAMVRATPPGTTIRVLGRDEEWVDNVELSVADGDSLIVQFERAGYRRATRTFRGNRLAVSLQPDSVLVTFEANVPAVVFLSPARGSRRRLGITPFTARLRTGSHDFVWLAPDQPVWTTTQLFPEAGQQYTVQKTDYLAVGGMVITVAGTWAWVSVDGGPDRETPLRLDSVPAGTHTIRVSREGFTTVTDTVVIRPGQIATKQYSLRPRT